MPDFAEDNFAAFDDSFSDFDDFVPVGFAVVAADDELAVLADVPPTFSVVDFAPALMLLVVPFPLEDLVEALLAKIFDDFEPFVAFDEVFFPDFVAPLVELFSAIALVSGSGTLHSQVSPRYCGRRPHCASGIKPAFPILCSLPQGVSLGGTVLNMTTASGFPTSFPSPQMLHELCTTSQRDSSANRTMIRGCFMVFSFIYLLQLALLFLGVMWLLFGQNSYVVVVVLPIAHRQIQRLQRAPIYRECPLLVSQALFHGLLPSTKQNEPRL